jgi:hypothetical protein
MFQAQMSWTIFFLIYLKKRYLKEWRQRPVKKYLRFKINILFFFISFGFRNSSIRIEKRKSLVEDEVESSKKRSAK